MAKNNSKKPPKPKHDHKDVKGLVAAAQQKGGVNAEDFRLKRHDLPAREAELLQGHPAPPPLYVLVLPARLVTLLAARLEAN